MNKTKLIEHQVIAHCAAFLISKRAKIDSLAIKKQHIVEVKGIIKTDLINKYEFDKKKCINSINEISYNTTRHDILGAYYHGRKRHNKRIIIEAKGGNVMYAIYTVIGQLICSRDSPSSYWWFGFACPNTWRKYIYNKMTINKQIRPLVNEMIKFTHNGQGLYFYFVDEPGFVERITWKRFLQRNKHF